MAAILRLIGASEDPVGAEADAAVGESDAAEIVVLSEDEFLVLLRRAALDDLAEAA